MTGGNAAAVRAPESLLQLFIMMGKGFIKGIPTLLKKSLLKLAIIFGVIVIFNTYLLVVKNEGFSPTFGNKWLDITALQGNVAWATTFWTFAMFFFTTVLARIKEEGFNKFMADITDVPGFFSEKKNQSGKPGLSLMLFTIIGILLLTLFVPTKRAFLLYSIIAFLSFTKKEESFLMVFFTLFMSDVKKLFGIKKKISQANLYMMTFSVWLAFLIAYVIKSNFYIIIIMMILGGLGFYINTQSKAAKTMTFLLMFLGANAIYYQLSGKILADDGGWVEAGGTLGGWVQSQGAGTALGMGIPPAGGGLLGALAGWVYTGMNPSDFIPSASVFTDVFDDYVDYADDFVTGVGQDFQDGADYVSDLANGMYEEGVTYVDEVGDYVSDAADGFYNDAVEFVDEAGDFITQAGTEAAEFTSDFLNNVYQDLTTGDYVPIDESAVSDDFDYTNVKDYISMFSNAVGNSGDAGKVKDFMTMVVDKTSDFKGYMKDMIKNSDEYADAARQYLGDPKGKLSWLKKSFDKMKSSKATSGVSKLGTFLNVLGGGLDWYDNVQNGDSIFDGGAKSAAANSIAIALAEKAGSATIAAWELGNTVLFGGSNASKVFSPVTTVKGGVNFLYDYMTGMDQTKLMERLHDTNNGYGENIKNLYYAADFAEDFVSDPGQFYETVGDMTQAGGEGWEGINKSADDLFRLPDDVRNNTKNLYSSDALNTVWENPLDSTRKVATDAAHLATKTAIKVGEGWAYIGESAGHGSIWVENKVSSGWSSFKSLFR